MATSGLASLALVFAQLSLFAVGGANAVIPEMQRHFVGVAGAGASGPLDAATFASLIALAQAAPGPNAMVVGLVGWHVEGGLGALVATLAFCGPPAVATLAVGRAWGRLRATGIGPIVIRGVAPLTVGLVLASGWSLTRAETAAAGPHALPLAITAVVALGALWRSSAGMWLLASAAAVAVAIG
jgi:chromate transporter